jgi:hypothetical protein
MAEDFEEEGRRKRGKKGKSFFTKKRVTLIVAVIALLALGALIQHFVIEPLYGETIEQKYARCLTQKEVLDQRFVQCSNEQQACEYQLNQCLGTG